jgi:hypothetical protein
MTIVARYRAQDQILTLCEVEVFGSPGSGACSDVMPCKATFVDNVGAQFPGQPLHLTATLSCLPPPAGAGASPK